MGFWGFGFRVWGLGFRVLDLGFGVEGWSKSGAFPGVRGEETRCWELRTGTGGNLLAGVLKPLSRRSVGFWV